MTNGIERRSSILAPHSTSAMSQSFMPQVPSYPARQHTPRYPCFLYLKPFLESVESGFMRADDIRRRGTDDYYGHTTGGSSTMRSAFSIRKHINTGSQSIGLVAISSLYNTTTVTANEPPDMDAESQDSRAQIIKETRTFAVEDSTNES